MYMKLSSFPKPQKEEIPTLKFAAMSASGNRTIALSDIAENIDPDILWDKMYAHAKKVIVRCEYCGSHNAVGNSTCVSCGAPSKWIE